MSTTTQTQRINLTEIEVGDVFSEMSHYSFLKKEGNNYQFKHLESGKVITLDPKYVSELLQTADQYQHELKVGKEDKLWTQKQIDEDVKAGLLQKNHSIRVGDIRVPGIRRIWADINGQQVFTVSFNKQEKSLSQKALNEAKTAQLQEAINKITAAQKAKKGVASAATEAIKEIQNNPILSSSKGEERILRGYKIQFQSINGMYDVIDMDITSGMNVRKVNVNEINFLVIGNYKYIVE